MSTKNFENLVLLRSKGLTWLSLYHLVKTLHLLSYIVKVDSESRIDVVINLFIKTYTFRSSPHNSCHACKTSGRGWRRLTWLTRSKQGSSPMSSFLHFSNFCHYFASGLKSAMRLKLAISLSTLSNTLAITVAGEGKHTVDHLSPVIADMAR